MSEHFYSVPAVVGKQGNIRHFVVTIKFSVLKNIIGEDESASPLKRAQRELNHKRTGKIASYVQSGEPYFLPGLSGNLEGVVDFTPLSGSEDIGLLHLRKGSIKLFDGQHRAVSISLIATPDYEDDTISIELTDNAPLEMRQQFFSDINYNAVRTSAALNKAYDKRDPRNELAQYVSRNCGFSMHYFDFEQTVLKGNNQHVMSFKALYDCMVRMFRLNDKTTINEDLCRNAVYLFDAWSSKLLWGALANDPGYRLSYLSTHGVLLNAIGLATWYMLQAESVEAVAERISSSDLHYRKDFSYESLSGRCVDPSTWKIKTDVRAVKLAAIHLLQRLNFPLPDELQKLENEAFGLGVVEAIEIPALFPSDDVEDHEFWRDSINNLCQRHGFDFSFPDIVQQSFKLADVQKQTGASRDFCKEFISQLDLVAEMSLSELDCLKGKFATSKFIEYFHQKGVSSE